VPGPADESGTTGGRLLLVEDDVNVAKLYRMLLESRGYAVRHASDGVEGLDAARQERPDLILLDVMMPRMNGITFLQALREDPSLGAVPTVVLSNFREPRLVERAMALGALEYMVKAQTRPETLVGAIPHWLRGERAVHV
jgi:CheY-like chemotaxis protein